MSAAWVILAAIIYLAGLFGLAWWGDRQAAIKKKWIQSSWIYGLSLAVYCTAWTFYGSVGLASESGLNYVAIYIGPCLIIPLTWVIWRRIIRIRKMQRISSFPEFLSSRFGKSNALGVLVALLMVMGVIPYISIQLKAISESFEVMTMGGQPGDGSGKSLFSDTAFYFALAMILFTILFSNRKQESTERNAGLVLAIAVESVVKLIAFLIVGVFITFFVLDDPLATFSKALELPENQRIFHVDGGSGYADWFFLIILSMAAFLLLPRQFQVGVLENADEKHLIRSMWLFPMYLFLINLLVIPVALVGNLVFQEQAVSGDTYVLAIPLESGAAPVALIGFIGGFAASTSMIIVSAVALGNGLSNNLLIPLVLRYVSPARISNKAGRWAQSTRRVAIGLVILMAYLFYRLIAEPFSLVFIGLTSMVAVAQFAPALIGGLFWKEANRKGATYGLLVGFGIWIYTLILPILLKPDSVLLQEGPLGMTFLKPTALFGMEGLDFIAHGAFWSLFFNLVVFTGVSLYTRQSSVERNQAEVFVDVFRYDEFYESSIARKVHVSHAEIRQVLERFHPKSYVDRAFLVYSRKYNVELVEEGPADPGMINFAEKMLTGIIGAASARMILSTVVREEEIDMEDVLSIMRESQSLIASNKELKRTSDALRRTSKALKTANERLRNQDELKDEFLYTVTHELRTPLTTILAMSEILSDHNDLEAEERKRFLDTITQESERMSRLIAQVLDLEKYESGKQKLNYLKINLKSIVEESCFEIRPQAESRQVQLKIDLQPSVPETLADVDRLKQVMLNLLANAVKFADKEAGKIAVSLYYLDGDLKVNVQDNGPGIREEDHERIFDKFFQVKHKFGGQHKGSGLGLAICRQIVELHGGRIWVESELGKGTKFSFLIPVRA